jgi:hypothetical protein
MTRVSDPTFRINEPSRNASLLSYAEELSPDSRVKDRFQSPIRTGWPPTDSSNPRTSRDPCSSFSHLFS